MVYDKYISGGAAAAIEFGASLELAAGTVRSWIGAWSKNGGGEKPPPAPKADRPSKAPQQKPVVARGRRVVASWNGKRHGSVIQEGAEVSTVSWDKAYAGEQRVEHVPNKYLHDLERG